MSYNELDLFLRGLEKLNFRHVMTVHNKHHSDLHFFSNGRMMLIVQVFGNRMGYLVYYASERMGATEELNHLAKIINSARPGIVNKANKTIKQRLKYLLNKLLSCMFSHANTQTIRDNDRQKHTE